MILDFYLFLVEISVQDSALIWNLKALSTENKINYTNMLFGIFRTLWQILLKIDSKRLIRLCLVSLMNQLMHYFIKSWPKSLLKAHNFNLKHDECSWTQHAWIFLVSNSSKHDQTPQNNLKLDDFPKWRWISNMLERILGNHALIVRKWTCMHELQLKLCSRLNIHIQTHNLHVDDLDS